MVKPQMDFNVVHLPPERRLWWLASTIYTDIRTYVDRRQPWTRGRFRAAPPSGIHNPIFVIGAPRSGTTFLGNALAMIPSISYHFEPVATKAAAPYIALGLWSADDAAAFFHRVYAMLLSLHGDGDKRFAEKTPQLAFLVPFLADAFPQALFVHIIRDGRDAAVSYRRKPWLQETQRDSNNFEPGGYRYGPFARFWVESDRVDEFESTTDLHRCIWGWRRFVEAAQLGLETLPPERSHIIRYEKLVTDPYGEADRLGTFLDLVTQEEQSPLRRELERAHRQSVGSWRDELTSEEVDVVRREAGALLTSLGYTP